MRTRQRWWRWRRNPLRRRCDVVEAWTALALGIAFLFGVPAAGFAAGDAAYGAAHSTAVAQRGSSRPVDAVLVHDAPVDLPPANGGSTGKERAAVRWTEADGTVHTGIAKVNSATPGGQHLRIWLDVHGRVVDEPLDDSQVWLSAVSWATIAALGAAGTLLAVRYAVQRYAERHRLAEWELAWARTEPGWRRPRT
ncbi:hypothetical protein [Streptomyces sp. NPDC059991]|uniref:Rv1733c family protein n=1 Tax=unclassified Streptomyces TaxID=2593676 RepID=UPI0036B99530